MRLPSNKDCSSQNIVNSIIPKIPLSGNKPIKKEQENVYFVDVNPDLNRLQIKRSQRLETLKWF